MPTFKKIADFGVLHKNQKRIIVVTLQEVTGDDNTRRYISFHEHFLNDKGELIPRRITDPSTGKYKEIIVSFSLPYTESLAKELAEVSHSIADFLSDTPQPANLEGEDPF